MSPLAVALLLALPLIPAGRAMAQPAAQPAALVAATPAAAPGTAMDRLGEVFDVLGNGASATWRAATALVLPEAPLHYLPERLAESDIGFIGMMESAGLTFAEIRTGGGLLPDAAYRFIASREPSAQDIARARDQLVRHGARYSGLRALAQQRILQTVLDAADGGSFIITELEVTVRPWPGIRYTLSARQRPLDDPQRRLLEALRGLPR